MSTPSHATLTIPPRTLDCLVSYPAPFIALVTINRERKMNAISWDGHWEMERFFTWFDQEPSLHIAIITGAGKDAFCAGQDLIALGRAGESDDHASRLARHPPTGFLGLSRRSGRKPIIAAVNGLALGGGFEVALNCDMVIASPNASFGLPEALWGVYAGLGGPARLVRNCGLQISSEIALTGRRITAQEAFGYHIVNRISKSPGTLVKEAIEIATHIAKASPEAVIVARAALREAWETASVERATSIVAERYSDSLMTGENAREGLLAFAEKRQPIWKPSKL